MEGTSYRDRQFSGLAILAKISSGTQKQIGGSTLLPGKRLYPIGWKVHDRPLFQVHN